MTDMLKKFYPLFFAVLFLGLFSAPLFAQTAADMENLLRVQKVSYAQAARFVLAAADAASLQDLERAYPVTVERRWLPRKADATEAARLDDISLLLMQAFDIKGGMWYSLTKSPHHAYRELVYQDIIQDKADPEMTISGEELLFLINRLLSYQESAAAGKDWP